MVHLITKNSRSFKTVMSLSANKFVSLEAMKGNKGLLDERKREGGEKDRYQVNRNHVNLRTS